MYKISWGYCHLNLCRCQRPAGQASCSLHTYLQSETIDLAKAVEYKRAVCDTFKQMHTDDTVRICAANQIPEPCTVTKQRQKRMKVYVVDFSCGAVSGLNDAEKLK